jgi:hypothetical protein
MISICLRLITAISTISAGIALPEPARAFHNLSPAREKEGNVQAFVERALTRRIVHATRTYARGELESLFDEHSIGVKSIILDTFDGISKLREQSLTNRLISDLIWLYLVLEARRETQKNLHDTEIQAHEMAVLKKAWKYYVDKTGLTLQLTTQEIVRCMSVFSLEELGEKTCGHYSDHFGKLAGYTMKEINPSVWTNMDSTFGVAFRALQDDMLFLQAGYVISKWETISNICQSLNAHPELAYHAAIIYSSVGFSINEIQRQIADRWHFDAGTYEAILKKHFCRLPVVSLMVGESNPIGKDFVNAILYLRNENRLIGGFCGVPQEGERGAKRPWCRNRRAEVYMGVLQEASSHVAAEIVNEELRYVFDVMGFIEAESDGLGKALVGPGVLRYELEPGLEIGPFYSLGISESVMFRCENNKSCGLVPNVRNIRYIRGTTLGAFHDKAGFRLWLTGAKGDEKFVSIYRNLFFWNIRQELSAVSLPNEDKYRGIWGIEFGWYFVGVLEFTMGIQLLEGGEGFGPHVGLSIPVGDLAAELISSAFRPE